MKFKEEKNNDKFSLILAISIYFYMKEKKRKTLNLERKSIKLKLLHNLTD